MVEAPPTPTLFTIFPAHKPKWFPGNRVKQLHFDGIKHDVNVPQIRKKTVNMCESIAAWLQGGGGGGEQLNSGLYSMCGHAVPASMCNIYLCMCVRVLKLLCVLHECLQLKSQHLDLIFSLICKEDTQINKLTTCQTLTNH